MTLGWRVLAADIAGRTPSSPLIMQEHEYGHDFLKSSAMQKFSKEIKLLWLLIHAPDEQRKKVVQWDELHVVYMQFVFYMNLHELHVL